MPIEETRDLKKFLKVFPKERQELALLLREFVWKLYPDSNELIYDNYNALAFGWSTSDRAGEVFCSIAVGTTEYIHFGFYWGSKIADPDKILLGNGKQYRYIKVYNTNDFPKTAMKKMLKEAHAYSMSKMKVGEQTVKGTTIIKAISAKKRRPK